MVVGDSLEDLELCSQRRCCDCGAFIRKLECRPIHGFVTFSSPSTPSTSSLVVGYDFLRVKVSKGLSDSAACRQWYVELCFSFKAVHVGGVIVVSTSYY